MGTPNGLTSVRSGGPRGWRSTATALDARWAQLSRGQLVSGAAKTFVANALVVGISVVSAACLSRGLGPEGRAAFEAIVFLPRFLGPIVEVGLSEANAYFMSRSESGTEGALLANTLIIAAVIGLPVAALCIPLLPLWLHQYDSETIALAALVLLTLPLAILNTSLWGLLRGQQRYTVLNIIYVSAPVSDTLLWGALFLAGQLTVQTAVAAHVFSWAILALVLKVIVIGRPALMSIRFRRASLTAELRYGFRCLAGRMTEATNESADRALLITLLPAAESASSSSRPGFRRSCSAFRAPWARS